MTITANATAAEPSPADPIEGLRKLFVDITQKNRILAGQAPARRAVFLKPHGSVYGTFRMRPDRPAALRIGVFAADEFPAWVRFSSDTIPGLPDTKTTCGVGIKLFNVPGADARKVVYAASAQLRRDRNGVALVEPRAPRDTQ